MNIMSISEVLKQFVENHENKSILIDGPWGCGKTHQINEYIKEYNKNNRTSENKTQIYYVSLFGLESIDEIHTAVYYQMFPKTVKFKKIASGILKGASVISKTIPYIEKAGDVCDGLDAQLGNISKEKIKKSSIIVFDDLERISTSISYINFLGYINTLFASNCRIICLVNSQEIQNDTCFASFKEKVFDSIYTISQTNIDLLWDIFKKFQISNIQYTFDLFENNLRMAKKTSIFYDKLIDIFNNYDASIKNTKHSEFIIFQAAIYTVLIALKGFENINKEYYSYEKDKASFGESVANGLKYYFSDKESDFEMNTISHLTRKMLHFFMFNDKSYLVKYFFSKTVIKDDSILDKEFFYLSETNKQKYFVELEKLIQSEQYVLKEIVSKISVVIRYSKFSFSDLTIKCIAKFYINEFDNNSDHIAFHLHLVDVREKNTDSVKTFLTRIKEEIVNLIITENVSKIQEFKTTRDYRKLYDFINSIFRQSKPYGIERINEYLIKEKFYMPNLSNDITGDEWEYSHLIAKYVAHYNLSEHFISLAKTICSEDPTNETLIDRYHSLIIYNIDNSFPIEDLTD